jgi:hypothetical protein
MGPEVGTISRSGATGPRFTALPSPGFASLAILSRSAGEGTLSATFRDLFKGPYRPPQFSRRLQRNPTVSCADAEEEPLAAQGLVVFSAATARERLDGGGVRSYRTSSSSNGSAAY